MNKPVIYFRADGDNRIGLGHVIRCCALASMLRPAFNCSFFIREPSDYLADQIFKSGCKMISLPYVESYACEAVSWSETLSGSEIIVLDGYHFDTVYQQCIKERQCKLVCIDDIHTGTYLADVLINHAGGARCDQYLSAFYTQFFLGFKYSLLRVPFLSGRQLVQKPLELLICLGGADPENAIQKVYEETVRHNFSKIHLLVGAAYHHRQQLQARIDNNKVETVLHQNLEAEGVAALMQQCSHAVLSPSSIVLEYMSFGGAVYLYQIADNQKHIRQYLLESGLAKSFEELGKVSVEEENALLVHQKKVFDGRSGERLLQLFESLAFMKDAIIVRATKEDTELTFEWANDPVSREMSFTRNPITKEEHTSWFLKKIGTPETYYYIFRKSNKPFAQVRFDDKKDFYLLSYFIAPEFRGMGFGSFILAEGISQLKKDLSGNGGTVIGFVKKNNLPSCRSFEKMKFHREDATEYTDSFKYSLQF